MRRRIHARAQDPLDKYDEVWGFSEEGIAAAKLITKEGESVWGAVTRDGKVIVPFEYDDIGNFGGGVTWVRLNNKYGFVNNKGRRIVPLQYDDIGSPLEDLGGFPDTYLPVKLDYKWGLVNTKGEEVLSPEYDREIINQIPRACHLLAYKLNISKEEAIEMVLKEMEEGAGL